MADSRYKLFRENRTWDDARQLCIDRGGYLAELTTRAELDSVLQALGMSHITLAVCRLQEQLVKRLPYKYVHVCPEYNTRIARLCMPVCLIYF